MEPVSAVSDGATNEEAADPDADLGFINPSTRSS